MYNTTVLNIYVLVVVNIISSYKLRHGLFLFSGMLGADNTRELELCGKYTDCAHSARVPTFWGTTLGSHIVSTCDGNKISRLTVPKALLHARLEYKGPISKKLFAEILLDNCRSPKLRREAVTSSIYDAVV